MYVSKNHENGKIEIQEHFRCPTVYLDNWALNDLALDKDLRCNFVQSMNENGGTLRLSAFNIFELSKQADTSQVNAILDMIRDIEDCGFINIDPNAVIAKEDDIVSRRTPIVNPSADLDLITAHLIAQGYPSNWHVSDIFRICHVEQLPRSLFEKNARFTERMTRLLEASRKDPDNLSRASRRLKQLKARGPKYETATRELFSMAVDYIATNKSMKMSAYSEWVDIFHVVVPVAYCDIVLIDKRWRNFVNQTGFKPPQVAMVFDKRSLDQFFEKLEEWPLLF
jgi:hypothetical protein